MSIEIPPSEDRDLSPEELDPFKETLMAHLRVQSPSARELVDKNFHVSRGTKLTAYFFTLHSLVESREWVQGQTLKPFSEDEAKKIATPAGPPSPPAGSASARLGPAEMWSSPSETRPDYTAYAQKYFIPNTVHVKECVECHQRGEIACKPCLGKGRESCPGCLGSGKQTCVFCKGAEKVSCLRCGGEGKLASGEVGGRVARCDACQGSGKFSCTHCQGGKIHCPQCQGGGDVACQKCQGEGKLACSICGGKKKVIVGQAFRSAFTPAQSSVGTFLASGPKEALEMVLQKMKDAGSQSLPGDVSFETLIASASLSPSVHSALKGLMDKEKAQTSASARVVKRRLDVRAGSGVRITGYCAGQEFAYWMVQGDARVIPELDPLSTFGRTAAASADEARLAGDWKKALTLARESLSFSPEQTIARYVISEFRRRVVGECLWFGAIGALVSAAAHVGWVHFFIRGLHKGGAMIQAAAAQCVLGPLAAVAFIPVAMRIPHPMTRRLALGAGLTSVFLMVTGLVRLSGQWEPVRRADQAALDEEFDGHFRYGIPQVYYEPDLAFLQTLQTKYKNTDADLRRVVRAVVHQGQLRDQLAAMQKEFDVHVEEISRSDWPIYKKRAALSKLVNDFRASGVDPKLADAALTSLASSASRLSRAPAQKPTSHIHIYKKNAPGLAVRPKPGSPQSPNPIKGSRKSKLTSSANNPAVGKKKKAWWE